MNYLLGTESISFVQAFPEIEPSSFLVLVRQGKCGNYPKDESNQSFNYDQIRFVICNNSACSGGGLDLPNKLYSLIREMIEKNESICVKDFCCRGHEIKPTKYDIYGKDCAQLFGVTISFETKLVNV